MDASVQVDPLVSHINRAVKSICHRLRPADALEHQSTLPMSDNMTNCCPLRDSPLPVTIQPLPNVPSSPSTLLFFHLFCQMEAVGDRGEAESESGSRGQLTQAPGQTSVLHFFSKLRRHASLEGAGPYFRRWKFDSSHRAASLDAKGLNRFVTAFVNCK